MRCLAGEARSSGPVEPGLPGRPPRASVELA